MVPKPIKNYVVYSTPTCPSCNQLKQWLDEKDVKYEVVDLTQDPLRGQEMIQKTGQMVVPVSIIIFDDAEEKEEIVIGFDREKLIEVLGL
jgi:glutaredoxin 3